MSATRYANDTSHEHQMHINYYYFRSHKDSTKSEIYIAFHVWLNVDFILLDLIQKFIFMSNFQMIFGELVHSLQCILYMFLSIATQKTVFPLYQSTEILSTKYTIKYNIYWFRNIPE